MAIEDRYRNLPFDEAIADLRGKVPLDTDRWDDVLDAERDAIFASAKIKGDMLGDVQAITVRGIEEGWRGDRYRQEFERVTAGWGGDDKAWRARIVYDTNLRQSYAAGRYAYQLDPEVKLIFPYLKFIHSDASRPRPAHKALDGKVFPADQMPFYPPSGFGCGCRAVSVSQRQLQQQGLEVSALRRGDLVEGTVILQPERGFDHIPGRSTAAQRQQMIADTAARLSGLAAEQFLREVQGGESAN